MGPVVFPVSFATTLGPRYQYLLHTHILQICGLGPLLRLCKDLGIEPSNPTEETLNSGNLGRDPKKIGSCYWNSLKHFISLLLYIIVFP